MTSKDTRTSTVEAAAAVARESDPGWDDEPIPNEYAEGPRVRPDPAYNGRCRVCGWWASPLVAGGVKCGPIHPACDRREGVRDPAEDARYRAEGGGGVTAWIELRPGERLPAPDEPEWHGGGSAMRGYPAAIRVQACPDCGLRVGQQWQDCPVSGFRHREGETRIYIAEGQQP